jgi:hypothetical protein
MESKNLCVTGKRVSSDYLEQDPVIRNTSLLGDTVGPMTERKPYLWRGDWADAIIN